MTHQNQFNYKSTKAVFMSISSINLSVLILLFCSVAVVSPAKEDDVSSQEMSESILHFDEIKRESRDDLQLFIPKVPYTEVTVIDSDSEEDVKPYVPKIKSAVITLSD